MLENTCIKHTWRHTSCNTHVGDHIVGCVPSDQSKENYVQLVLSESTIRLKCSFNGFSAKARTFHHEILLIMRQFFDVRIKRHLDSPATESKSVCVDDRGLSREVFNSTMSLSENCSFGLVLAAAGWVLATRAS